MPSTDYHFRDFAQDWSFVKTRLLSTALAGLRFRHSKKCLPFSIIIAQLSILLFLLFLGLLSSYLFNEYYLSAPVLAFLTLALYLALRVIASRYIYKRLHSSIASDAINLEKEEDFGDFKGTNAWRFLFPQVELPDAIYGAVIAALYGASLGFYLNNDQTANLIPNESTRHVWLLLASLTSAFNGFSLLSGDIPEPADFNTEGSKSILWRTKNLRPSYLILFSLIELIIYHVTDDQRGILTLLRWVYVFTPALFCFALFSVPAATVLWLVQKCNLWLAGIHTNSTTLRSLISAVIAIAFALISALLYYNADMSFDLPLAVNIALAVLNAYTGSIVYTLALSRSSSSSDSIPYLKEAQFSNSKREYSSSRRKLMLLKIIAQPVLHVIVGVVSVIVVSDMSGDDMTDLLLSISGAIGTVALILSISARLQFNKQSESCWVRGIILHQVLNQLYGACSLFTIVYAISRDNNYVRGSLSEDFTILFWESTLIMGAVCLALQDTFKSALSFLLAMLLRSSLSVSSAQLLITSGLILTFLQNFLSRLWYASISFKNICQPHKINLKGGSRCIAIYLTVGMPVFLTTLSLSALFDTPLVPLLGFPLFLCGFLRPKRDWIQIRKLQPGIDEMRSDGHLYRAILKPLLNALQSQLLKDPNLLREDDFFLLKREKILMLGNVAQKGAGHLVVNIKGAELQEMTECHQHESQGIERSMKRLADSRCNLMLGSVMTPLKVLTLQHYYDDLKFLLTGNVESSEFKEELKKLFAKTLALCLAHMAKDMRLKKLGLFDQSALRAAGSEYKKYFDSQWHLLLGVKEKYQQALKLTSPLPVAGLPKQAKTVANPVVKPVPRKMDFLESISQKMPERPSMVSEKAEPKHERKNSQRPVRTTKQSQTANLFEILDDIDDDDSEEQVNSLLKDPPAQFKQLRPEKASKPFEDDDLEKELESIYQPKKQAVSLPKEQEVPDFTDLLYECFLVVYGKEYFSKEQFNEEDYYGLFCGCFPATVEANKLEEESEQDARFEVARALILKAFRIAFHLAFDNSVNYMLGEELPHQELRDMLLETEREWLLGSEPRLWNGGIGRNVAQMERIIREEKRGEQTQYKMHRLIQKRNQKIHLFGMKGSAVRGIQANMALELLYFSNNNDERFSIQSEESLLRNLLVQFTEAPLGYSVYSSGPTLLYY